jgi:hypothetical protein
VGRGNCAAVGMEAHGNEGTPMNRTTLNVWLFVLGFLMLIPSLSRGEAPRGVPTKLFGILLGGIYDVGNSEMNDLGNIPIRKFAGMNQFLGNGIHYYFQPVDDNKAFEYVEKRKKPEDKYFETSFRLYMLPVIPTTVKTIEQLDAAKVKMEVVTIEWSVEPKSKDDAYYWAIDLCKTIELDISVRPKIDNFYDSKNYTCTFSAGEREFKVSSFYSKSISLSYRRDVFDKKDKALEKTLRKLRAEKIRPY